MSGPLRWFIALSVLAGMCVLPARAAEPQPGSLEWMQRDAMNMAYATQRQQDMTANPAFGSMYWTTAAPIFVGGLGDQARHPDRPAPGLSRIAPGEAADPYRQHWDGARGVQSPIEYMNGCGARIQGTVFAPKIEAPDPLAPGQRMTPPFPGVVITTGSIQGYEEMYWWAAQGLAEAGYVVMTFDVMGQGESQWQCPDGGTATGFEQGTLDALNFFLSDANPQRAVLDATRLGLAGHSAGGFAVTKLGNQPRITLRLFGNIPNPIDAVVAWDSAALGGSTPRIPTMSQNAEYFFNPTPAAAGPAENKRAWYDAFAAAGKPAFQLSLRGSTHLEWTFVPYILPASRKGERVAMHYTLAWFDRWVKGAADPAVAASATARLLSTTFDGSADTSSIGAGVWDPSTNTNVPNTIAGETVSDHLSIYYKTSYRFDGYHCNDVRTGSCSP